jgi:hypothetical protein
MDQRRRYGGKLHRKAFPGVLTMRQIKARSVLDGVQHHKLNPVREYSRDGVQEDRIKKARRYLSMALVELGPGRKTIMELGCGTMDISGPLSINHEVMGIECNTGCIAKARELYPQAVVREGVIEEVEPFRCDVVVLCEILEHLHDPKGLVIKWLPLARAAVISHPLDEALDSQLSGGDHCWSFSEDDLRDWYEMAGYNMRDGEIFQMGSYRIGLTRGVRV